MLSQRENHPSLSFETLAEQEQNLTQALKVIQNKIKTLETQINQTLLAVQLLEEKQLTVTASLATESSKHDKMIKELQRRSDGCIALLREISNLKEQNVQLQAKMPAVSITEKIRYSLSGAVNILTQGQPKPADPNVRVIFANPLTPYEVQQQLKKEIADNERLIAEKETTLATNRENRDYLGKTLLPKWEESQVKNRDILKRIEKAKAQKEEEKNSLNKELEEQSINLKKGEQSLIQTYFLIALKKIVSKLELLSEISDKHQKELIEAENDAHTLDFTFQHLRDSLLKLNVFYELNSAINLQIDSQSYAESIQQATHEFDKLNKNDSFYENAARWLNEQNNNYQALVEKLSKLQKKIQRTLQGAAANLILTLDYQIEKIADKNDARFFIHQIQGIRLEFKNLDRSLLSNERKILDEYYVKAANLLYPQPIVEKTPPKSIAPTAKALPAVDTAALRRYAICQGYSILLVKYLHYRNKHHRFFDFIFKKARRARNDYVLTLKKALDTYQATNNLKDLNDALKFGQKYKPSFFGRAIDPKAHPEKHLFGIVSLLERQIKLS